MGADVILTARRFVLYGDSRVKYTGVHESALTARVNWQADAEEEPPPLPPARGLDLLASQAEDLAFQAALDAKPAGNSTQAAFVRGQVSRHKVAN